MFAISHSATKMPTEYQNPISEEAQTNTEVFVIGISKTKPNAHSSLDDLTVENDGRVIDTISIKGEAIAMVVEIPQTISSSVVANMKTTGLTRYVEPIIQFEAQYVPNDDNWTIQWGPKDIKADWAWNFTTGNDDILLAIIDSGIDYNHDDLSANYVSYGHDWVNNDTDPWDDYGHGTHCAGIASAVTNNTLGIAGLAQVQVMAEKVLGEDGIGYSDWIAKGIINATDAGAKIISMSLGGPFSEVVYDAIKYAYNESVLLVAAAGNLGTPQKTYPAGLDEVISVTAFDINHSIPEWIYNQGPNFGDWIELAAPGNEIFSTKPNQTYESHNGTSMAAPHVAGLAALVWGRYPNLTRDSVRYWLRATADDMGVAYFDKHYGYGRINAESAVYQSPPSNDLIALGLNVTSSVKANVTTDLEAIILNLGSNISHEDVEVLLLENGTLAHGDKVNVTISSLPVGNSSVVNFSWTPTEGTYNLSLYAIRQDGEAEHFNNLLVKSVTARFPAVLNIPSDYSNITAALHYAIPGDTINVSAGFYKESIIIDKDDLHLEGEGIGSTTIRGTGHAPVVSIGANNVTVTGFKILGKYEITGEIDVWGSESCVNIRMSSYVNISYNKVMKAYRGLMIRFSNNILIEGNYITENEKGGIWAGNLSDSEITGNNITKHLYPAGTPYLLKHGLVMDYPIRNNITDNQIVLNEIAILMRGSVGNIVSDNNVSSNQNSGITWNQGTNNTLIHNFIRDNGWEPEASPHQEDTPLHGLHLYNTCNNTMRNNALFGNYGNFGVDGSILEHFIHDIDTSNSAGHKSIYYWVNRHDEEVPWRAGYVALVNCSNIIAKGMTLQRNRDGALLAYTTNSSIMDSLIRYNNYGFRLINSSNNILAGNTVSHCHESGIRLYESSNNEIFHNTVSDQPIGLYARYSSNNTISHNNFFNNTHEDVSHPFPSLVNVWDLGYPLGGNYWSDYNGSDSYSGPYQNESGSDGIGDTPYIIDDYNNDSYPIMSMLGTDIQRDVAILNVTANSTVVVLGKSILISVEGKNQGHHFTEVLNVTTYAYNTTEELNYTIGTLNTTLLPLSNDTLIFNWNTTGVTSNVTYTIKAEATVVPYETDTTDNTYVDGTVFIRSYNNPPQTPLTPDGPTPIYTGQSKNYNSTASDPDSDQVWYEFDWDDDTTTEIGPYGSNVTGYYAAHTWVHWGIYDVKVRARDIFHDYSNWSDSHAVTVNHARGCPFVYVWNGTEFVIDNNLVTGSAKSNGTEVEDYYRLEQDLVPLFEGYFNSYYSLKISEFQQEHSYFDQVQLFAVDHQANVSVAASSTGEILTYQDPYPPITAVDEANVSWLAELSEIDGEYYEGYNGSFLVLNFGEVTGQDAKLVFQTDPPPPGDTKTSIYIQVLNSSESWVDVVSIIPRTYWATDIIDLSDYLPSDGELVVRFYFTFNHRVGFVGLDTTPQAAVDVEDAYLLLAYHSEEGFVTAELCSDDDVYAELVADQQITLLFRAPNPDAEARTFIFYVKGYYTFTG